MLQLEIKENWIYSIWDEDMQKSKWSVEILLNNLKFIIFK